MPCEQDSTAILLVLKHPITDKFNRTLVRFMPNWLLKFLKLNPDIS